MVCARAHTVDSWSSCHTVSVCPETASASRAVPGPEASTSVWAGVGGSSSHCCPGPPMVAACPPGSSTQVPPADVAVAPARPPDAVSALVTGSGADAVQSAEEDFGVGVAGEDSGGKAYQCSASCAH